MLPRRGYEKGIPLGRHKDGNSGESDELGNRPHFDKIVTAAIRGRYQGAYVHAYLCV